MSKLPTKFVITIVAAGILIGTVAMTIVAGLLTKSSNLVTAQPRISIQQSPSAGAPNAPSGPSFNKFLIRFGTYTNQVYK